MLRHLKSVLFLLSATQAVYDEHSGSLQVLKSPLAFTFVLLHDFPTLLYSLLVRQMCGKFIISALLLISQSMTS